MIALRTLMATTILVCATAAPAQLLGGGGGGGLAGGIAGGIGGMGGGLNGMANGTLNGNLNNGALRPETTALQRQQMRQLKADRIAQRKAEKAGMPAMAGRGAMPAATAGAPVLAGNGAGTAMVDQAGRQIAGNGGGAVVVDQAGRQLSGTGNGAVMVDRAGRQITGSGGGAIMVDRTGRQLNVAGSGNGALAYNGVPRLDANAFAARQLAAVEARGLRSIGRTGRGVTVVVPTALVSVAAVNVPRLAPAYASYPVYAGGYGYGGPDVVYVAGGETGGYMDRQYRDLQADVAGTGITVERRGADVVLQLPADVTFAFDRSDIQPRFVPALDAVARTVADYGGTDVEVIGHTDSLGSDGYNLALSQRRGASVADYLVYRNTDPSRLIVEAMGESEPIASNATIAGRAANRRVEIVLHPRSA